MPFRLKRLHQAVIHRLANIRTDEVTYQAGGEKRARLVLDDHVGRWRPLLQQDSGRLDVWIRPEDLEARRVERVGLILQIG